MSDEKKKIEEEDSEPKEAPKAREAPVAPVEAPVETPVESLAEDSIAQHKESNLKNLFDQMMESHDDLASYITESASAAP